MCARACSIVMGAKQTKEDETPTSPKSPRVSPVDIASDETPVPALLDISTIDEDSIKKSITAALDEAKSDKADDPNRINYTINAVDAIVDNRSRRTEQNLRVELAATQQRLEAELAATRKELSETQQQLEKMMALLERVAAKVKA